MNAILRLLRAAIVGLVPLAAAAQPVIITPDESVLVERYIVEEPALPPPVTFEEHQTLRPGSVVPDGVPLQPFAGRSNLSRFEYFVSVDDHLVLVDPATRVVVRIFEGKGKGKG